MSKSKVALDKKFDAQKPEHHHYRSAFEDPNSSLTHLSQVRHGSSVKGKSAQPQGHKEYLKNMLTCRLLKKFPNADSNTVMDIEA